MNVPCYLQKMGNHRHLSGVDIATLLEASESEEEDVSHCETHSSDRTENESSDNDFILIFNQIYRVCSPRKVT